MTTKLTLHCIALAIVLTGCTRSDKSRLARRIANVEQGLIRDYGDPPWKKMTLVERMEHHKVPGVSIAVIHDNRIEWAKGYGVLESGTTEPVTPETLFQAASVGKVVVAVAALHHVQGGKLKLDEDVNRRLTSWQVPTNGFAATARVTLRRLLSHQAGVTVSGFRGYARGEKVPDLKHVLNGQPPANSEPIRLDSVPGTRYRYSGGGYMIVQQLLEDVTGSRFPELMRKTVLDPWRMTASTFSSPLPERLRPAAARGHRADGSPIAGGWHTYPELGAGGSFWATPSDLARFNIAIMRAYHGQSDPVLSQSMAAAMLTPQTESRGLGPVLGDDGGDRFYFLHPGANEGYRCISVTYPQRRQGAVIMTNGDGGEALWREVLRSVSVEYGWVRDYTRLWVGIALGLLLAGLGVVLLRRRRARRRLA